jgi:hypothetical protein
MENIFNKEECSIVLDWDYKGYKKTSNYSGEQENWNHTLLSAIHQAGSEIFENTLLNYANEIRLHSKFSTLLETIYYFDKEKKELGSRYNVVFDDSLNNNQLLVYANEKIYSNIKSDMITPNELAEKKISVINILNYNSNE